MPLYEYQCNECGRRTEKIQKFSDPELTVCPFCSGRLERTLTAPAVQFKGGGWYKDLYSSAKPAAASGGDAAKPGDAGSSKPAESTVSSASSDSSASSSSSPSSTPSPSAAPASTAKS
jgi:putative FmdB family regulatory protein